MTAAPQDERWTAQVGDAANWLWHSAASTVINIPHTWSHARTKERMRIFSEIIWVAVLAVVLASVPDTGWYAWAALVVVAVAATLGAFADVEDDIHERERVLRMLQAKPSGAPTVAVLPCPNGEHPAHRWVYTPGGWQDAGSASGHGPNITIREARRG